MKLLNLTPKNKQEELILAYLQENASETLAEKINNGTPFEKDGTPLTNKKTLSGFMKYACDEARKLAEKGANSACVEDSVVYGWAIHYFEEDSIEETLYTLDGEEYKPAPKKVTPTKTATTMKPQPQAQQSLQFSFFDKIEENAAGVDRSETTEEDEDLTEEEKRENINPMYQKYLSYQAEHQTAIVAYRLGDFYEVFGNNAVTLGEELALTLTSRDFGLQERIPMIGFPYHTAENYFAKIKKKHDLYIIENDNEKQFIERVDAGLLSKINEDTGEIFDLTEEEMREFDGDIEEPRELTNNVENNGELTLITKSIDRDIMLKLYEMFDGRLEIK